MANQEIAVKNNVDASRFEVDVEGRVALIQYRLSGKRITFLHTEVPDEFEGQGIASKMAKTALNYARDNGLTVVPLCPFVRGYIERHPEYQPLVS